MHRTALAGASLDYATAADPLSAWHPGSWRDHPRSNSRSGPTRPSSTASSSSWPRCPPLVFAGEARDLTSAAGRGRRRARPSCSRRATAPSPSTTSAPTRSGTSSAGHPADGGGAHLLLGRPGGEGRPHRRAVRQAPLGRHPRRSTASSCRRSAATSSTTSRSTPSARIPDPERLLRRLPPVGGHAEPAARLHQGRLRRPVAGPLVEPGASSCTSPEGARYERGGRRDRSGAAVHEGLRRRHRLDADPPRGRLLHQPRGADPRLRGGAHPPRLPHRRLVRLLRAHGVDR